MYQLIIFLILQSHSANINFMAKYARGLICVPMEAERLNHLGLHPMKDNVLCHQQHQKSNTGWTISVDRCAGWNYRSGFHSF